MLEPRDIPAPDYENQFVLLSVADAIAKAEAGRYADGFACLQAGLERAYEHVRAGEPWGAALVERWERSLENFCRTYPVLA